MFIIRKHLNIYKTLAIVEKVIMVKIRLQQV